MPALMRDRGGSRLDRRTAVQAGSIGLVSLAGLARLSADEPAAGAPPALVLPERLVHREGRTIPGLFARG